MNSRFAEGLMGSVSRLCVVAAEQKEKKERVEKREPRDRACDALVLRGFSGAAAVRSGMRIKEIREARGVKR